MSEERLIKLLRGFEFKCPKDCLSVNYKDCNECKLEQLADYLLASGEVIVPPCKVGDMVYEIDLPEYGVIVCEVTKVLYDSKVVVVNVIDGHGKGSEYYFDFDDFGKTVFLTREEAEAKLRKEDEGK